MFSLVPGSETKITVAAIAMLITASGAGAASLTPQEEKLVEAAKKEGAVTVLNPIFSDRTGERLGAAFVKHSGRRSRRCARRSSPKNSPSIFLL